MVTKTKEELIHAVMQQAKITQAQAKRAVEAVAQNNMDTLQLHGRFVMPGVGVFSVVLREARKNRNIHTGEPIETPAHKAVKFKMSADLKERSKSW